ncbi:MAG: hypothetical protein IT449_05340 [Phycisphaerales bacterium]|nr:hypothetical protein [Phycisphaerales bacterium]
MSKARSKRNAPAPTDWDTVWPGCDIVTVKELKDEAVAEYVGWIDLMGAKGWMAGSIRHAAELVGLIHIAGKSAAKATTGAHAYPVIDGVYITSPDKAAFRKATHQTMRTLARTFESRKQIDRFLVRGGVAYGRVLHGEAIAALHGQLRNDEEYARCLAIGASIRQAYLAEGSAPPFGFYVDMTARSVASNNDSPYISSFDRWWRLDEPGQKRIATRFGRLLDDHFVYLERKHRGIEYPLARLQEHRALGCEYFRLETPNATK